MDLCYMLYKTVIIVHYYVNIPVSIKFKQYCIVFYIVSIISIMDCPFGIPQYWAIQVLHNAVGG